LSRLLSKDFLSGVMFIAFGLVALWFGRHLAMGTTVRMGPGYVPHMLAYIMLGLGGIIAVVALVSGGEAVGEKGQSFASWKPITASVFCAICSSVAWLAVSPTLGLITLAVIATALSLVDLIEGPKVRTIAMVVVGCAIGWAAHQVGETVICLAIVLVFFAMAWRWPATAVFKALFMVTVGIVCFGLLFESAGMLPALVALILVASLGGEEFKLPEVVGNMVVLTILCVIVFKVGLQMNVSILRGVW